MNVTSATGAVAVIDSAAIVHNLKMVRRLAPAARVLAVVKADGYGHGLLRVATALRDADGFAVARLVEAKALRDAGFSQRLVLLCGAHSAEELTWCRRQQIDVVVHAPHQLALLAAACGSASISVWLKLDSGMHRLGFPPQDVASVYRHLLAIDIVRKPVCVMTHLADADRVELPLTSAQVQTTRESVAGLDVELSMANSAAVLAHPDAHAQWVRPGIMLYGVSPFVGQCGQTLGLRPAMTLRTQLLAVQSIRSGEPIGYGGEFVCPETMPIATAAIGYADGLPRNAPNLTPFEVNQQVVPMVARVSMDTVTLDMRQQPSARAGERVTVWGPNVPVERLAALCDTIAYELLTRVGSRVPRIDA